MCVVVKVGLGLGIEGLRFACRIIKITLRPSSAGRSMDQLRIQTSPNINPIRNPKP